MRLKKWLKRLVVVGILFGLLAVGLYLAAFRAMGDRPQGERRKRMTSSPQWAGTGFGNTLTRVDGPLGEMLEQFLFGGSAYRAPTETPTTETRVRSDYDTAPASGLRVTWLGHSVLIIEIGGRKLLVDPVWGERASPFEFIGPKRFYPPPLPLDAIPDVDAILISHDHYDHLDYTTITALADRDVRWFVPLGVGAHLTYWGVPEANIQEFDWWDAATLENLTLTCTPSRHFSGRGLTDANRTLWSGWAIRSDEHNVYYSGDTAMFPGFIEIGQRLGPFDLTILEVGAYDALWADVHLGPEQAVRAHRLVKGRVMLPVHWGMFDLALHGWTDPIERVLVAAQRERVTVAVPRPGARIEPTRVAEVTRWWPDTPWVHVEEAPANSSGVEALNGPKYAPPAADAPAED